MRITLRSTTTMMTGVIIGTVMRHIVVQVLAPDMRLASSSDESMRRNAGVISMTLVEMPLETRCAQMMPQKEKISNVKLPTMGQPRIVVLTSPVLGSSSSIQPKVVATLGMMNEIQKNSSKTPAP